MADQILTQEYLHTVFTYKDGHLYWKKTGTGILKEQAGWQDKLGYWSLGLNRKTYKIHRLVYLMHHGYMPKYIDHIDNNSSNNRIENLRETTSMQNSWNQKNRKTNTSGYKGISWCKKSQKWTARCMMAGKSTFLGQYKNITQAIEIVRKFREENQGDFARHY
jgi:hypothetical protein